MDDAQRLHCFARRECMTRWRRWAEAYELLARAAQARVPYSYTDEDYAIFPRYNLDQAVLEAVETFDPDLLPDVETLRTELVGAASSAGKWSSQNEVEKRAVADERDALADAFMRCDVSTLPADSMPYRRVLGALEKARTRQLLADTWGAAGGYWYPLGERTHPTLIAFDLEDADEVEIQARVVQFISDHGAGRVLEVREYGPSYELEPAPEDFAYNGAERFWTPKTGEWVVYCSHERSITFGGSITRAFDEDRFHRGLIGNQPGSRWSIGG